MMGPHTKVSPSGLSPSPPARTAGFRPFSDLNASPAGARAVHGIALAAARDGVDRGDWSGVQTFRTSDPR